MKILDIIRNDKILSEEKINEIIDLSKKKEIPLIEVLKSKIDSEDFAKLMAKYYNLLYIDLTEKKIAENVLRLISREVAENYKVICFDKIDEVVKIGITDPGNFKAVEAIDFLAKEEKFEIEYFCISEDSFKKVFTNYNSLSKEVKTALNTRDQAQDYINDEKDEKIENLEEVTNSAPVAKIVSVIIRHAVDGGASDIHIEFLKKESRIRYRIDGILHTSLILPGNIHRAIVARIKIMANMKLDETRIPQGGRFKMIISNREVDFRVSTLPLVGSEKVVMRILDMNKGVPRIEDLGIQGKQLEIVKNNIKKTEGLFLITGPTGSGKSTTIFSLIDILNNEGINISTLEDPVEYQLKGINQSQIKPEIGYTFASGLRSFLRQDPDVIVVGEVRDEETAELVMHAALTGHFVLSTLHTNSALAVIARLVDMKVEPFLIASTLNTAIAQRLVRKICKHCKKEIKISEESAKEIIDTIKDLKIDYIKSFVSEYDGNVDKIKIYKGEGCPKCGNTGYSGRISILEVIDFNQELRDMLKAGKIFLTEDDIRQNQEFVTVKQDGVIKVLQGLTTFEEVLRVMSE